ncbi:hypothetical protein MMC14_000016 [Varicellaria rhodocarpa]|nr:hypothetical protein [Varicellaria rhodocarpa]
MEANAIVPGLIAPVIPLMQIQAPVIDRSRNRASRVRAPANTTRRAPSAFEFVNGATIGARRGPGRPRGSWARGRGARDGGGLQRLLFGDIQGGGITAGGIQGGGATADG